ncbi:MAG: SulP family inorganic anion transporter [Coriobacteriia bacterium]
MPAILEAWRAGLFKRDSLMRNISAGIVVGVVALPLAMAFAIASGAKPEQGLYTALVAGLLVTLLGGTRVQIAGPTGAFAVLLFGVTAKYGLPGLQIVTLLAGVMLLLLGLAKLGGVIRFIPESVVLGFTAGIAIVIFVGQWGNFFGLPKTAGATLYERLPQLLESFAHIQPTTTLLGLASLLIVALWPKIPVASKIPSPMVALIAATVFVTLAHPAGVETIGSAFGGIPRGLPPLTLPHPTMATLLELLQPAIAVALLGAIESLLSATVADGMLGTKHDPNQELVGQGIANLGAGLLGGFAATGAIARTATNIRHGGNSPVAGIAHAATILLVLVLLAPLAYNVPLTTLAAVLFVVAFNMSQIARVLRIARRSPRSDVGVMLVTLVLCVFADISVAVEVGVILALLNFFRRMTATVEVRPLVGPELASRLTAEQADRVPEGVLVFTVDGPFFFGAVEEFESALVHTDTVPDGIVIKLANVPFIDLTGLLALEDALEALEKRGVTVALCCATHEVAGRLERAKITGSASVPATSTLAEALAAVTPPRAD